MNQLFRFVLALLRLLWLAWRKGFTVLGRWLKGLFGDRDAPLKASSARKPSPRHQAAPLAVPVQLPQVSPESGVAPKGQFIAGVFKNEVGQRDYKLYIPPGATPALRPLVVMLHGCKQNPDDFALGTRMNELAEAQSCLVLYPAQLQAANGFYCWNWFHPRHQQREGGEPAIIAALIQEITARYAADPQRVFVAGLSAGAAMAVTLAHTHPELLAAVGVHSGLPHASASNMIAAMVVMKQGAGFLPAVLGQSPVCATTLTVPLILFQGDEDTTVHPRNGVQVMAQAGFRPRSGDDSAANRRIDALTVIEQGQVSQGYAYTCTRYRDPDRGTRAEHWLVHGAGHAWSGGSAKGSYTDSRGPDASAEFLRFFLSQGVGSLQ